MQEITVKEVRGPLGKGEKKFFAVVDERGGEFTTFDTKVKDIAPGSRLSIEVKVQGRYVNITEWKVIEGAAPQVPAQTHVNGSPAYGKTAEQFEAERRSTEAQTAYEGIIELIEQEAILKVDFVPGDLKELTFEWARVRLKATTLAKAAPAKKSASSPEKPAEPQENSFQNAGQFLTKCKEVWGMSKSEVLADPEVEKLFNASEFGKAYLLLAEKKAGKK